MYICLLSNVPYTPGDDGDDGQGEARNKEGLLDGKGVYLNHDYNVLYLFKCTSLFCHNTHVIPIYIWFHSNVHYTTSGQG